MTNPSIRGLFLDLDGTLADSMPVMRETYFRFLADRGAQGSQGEFDSLAGRPLSDIAVILKQAHGLGQSPLELLRAYLDTVESIYASQAKPMPGAPELLAHARGRGVFTAVVTSATSGQARDFLAHHGLEEYVSAVVGAEQVRRGKPDPEPYRLALRIAGLSPDQGLAAEDSAIGAASALGAGLATYIVRQEGGLEMAVPGAAGYIRRLDELARHLD